MKLELARETATAGTPEREQLDDLCADVERALTDLRELARAIFPASLADHGLQAALRAAANGSKVRIRIDGDLSRRRLAPELEAALYFCCLEVLDEVAPDSEVGIDLVDSGEELVLTLRVDGDGVYPAGLTRLRDRLAAFGGVVADSRNAAGTVVNCSVPIAVPSELTPQRLENPELVPSWHKLGDRGAYVVALGLARLIEPAAAAAGSRTVSLRGCPRRAS